MSESRVRQCRVTEPVGRLGSQFAGAFLSKLLSFGLSLWLRNFAASKESNILYNERSEVDLGLFSRLCQLDG